MATKTNERNTAYVMYVEQGKTAVEISKTLNVSERTVGRWIDQYKWKALRDAKLNAPKERAENIKRVISNLTTQTLELQERRKEAVAKSDKGALALIDLEAVGIADQISKWNKALAALDKASRITLDIYLEVMEDVFNNLRAYSPTLYNQTLDFQTTHIQFTSNRIG